jgi:deoxyhypusine synthase|tara:strand:+ start:28 stop:285 length:258 start_codon:yes stop_codon:yes gene_type:complete
MAKKSVKFQDEEVKSLKDIQLEMDQVIIRFGQIAINREALSSQENQLRTQLSELKGKENTLAQSLTEKYGKGTFDLENNEFTPVD